MRSYTPCHFGRSGFGIKKGLLLRAYKLLSTITMIMAHNTVECMVIFKAFGDSSSLRATFGLLTIGSNRACSYISKDASILIVMLEGNWEFPNMVSGDTVTKDMNCIIPR